VSSPKSILFSLITVFNYFLYIDIYLLNRCGEDAVVINWETSLEVIAPKTEKSLHFPLDSSVFLIQEVDCVRIITPQTQEILQKVPGVVRDIFRINSTDPGSYLLEASKQFQVGFMNSI
jgi:hypothetical protein